MNLRKVKKDAMRRMYFDQYGKSGFWHVTLIKDFFKKGHIIAIHTLSKEKLWEVLKYELTINKQLPI